MIKLIVEAKEPVYGEQGADPFAYQLVFGPDREDDNSAWTPEGTTPSLSASMIVNPEVAEAYNVGDAFYLPGKGEVVDLEEDPELRAAGGAGGTPDGQDGGDTGGDARVVSTQGPEVQTDGGGTLVESGSDVPPVTAEPDTQPPAKATAKTRRQ